MALFNQELPTDGNVPLDVRLLEFTDVFAEFQSVQSFLIHSYTKIMSSQEPIRPEVIQGAMQCASALEERTAEIKSALANIRKSRWD